MIAIWVYPMVMSSRWWSGGVAKRTWSVVQGANIAFIVFGLTSSHYFSRPSVSAIFMATIILVIYNNKKRLIELDRLYR